MKLDVEGAEQRCIDALHMLEKKPRIVTIEKNPQQAHYLFDNMRTLGYTDFKLVQQTENNGNLGSISGPLGALAPDCKLGLKWHKVQDYTKSYEKELVAHCSRTSISWYDWRFRHPDLNPPGFGLVQLAAARVSS